MDAERGAQVLALFTCVHVVAFKMAQFELFAFYFSLNNSIDLDRVSTTQADREDVINHGQGGMLIQPLYL